MFDSAYKAVKPGGTIVYSTCTINKNENEFILEWILNNYKVKLSDINLNIKDSIQGSNEGLNREIEKSIKILPSKDMEGFFVAKLKKV